MARGRGRERDVRYDVVRIVAMTFVVAVHALMVIDAGTPFGNAYVVFGQAVFYTCNALFFILSGRFNLTHRNGEMPGRFYLKKARGILIPVLILFLLRTAYNLWPQFPGLRAFGVAYVKNVLGAFAGTEYWFIYTLVSLLVVVPFLAPAFSRFDRKRQDLFIGIGFAWFTALFFLTGRGIAFSWTYLFTGFAFPFCIGPFVEERFKGRERVLWLAMPLCAVTTTWLVLSGFTSQALGAFDNSPLYMLLSIGMYLALLDLGGRVRGTTARRAILFVAKHSFTVYLVHLPVMHVLRALMPAAPGVLGYALHPLLALGTILVSLAVAIVLDAALIRPAQRLFDVAVSRLTVRRAG